MVSSLPGSNGFTLPLRVPTDRLISSQVNLAPEQLFLPGAQHAYLHGVMGIERLYRDCCWGNPDRFRAKSSVCTLSLVTGRVS